MWMLLNSRSISNHVFRRQSTCPAQWHGNGTALLFVDIVQVNWPLLGRCRRSSPGSDSTMSHIMLNPLPSIFSSSRPRIFTLTRPRFPSSAFNSRIQFVNHLSCTRISYYSLRGIYPRGDVERKGGTATFAFSRRRVTR